MGYYRDAGLTVTFQNKVDPDLIPLVGQGNLDIGIADGTDVIPAVSQGIPIKYLATIYAKNPNVLIAKAGSGITTVADLKGKKIGIPGEYGSSWVMLQALLKAANMTASDVQIVQYPDYGQAVALQQGVIDAATGFANNEPIQLEEAGLKLVILTLDNATPLPGPGLIAGTATLAKKPAALKAFIQATEKAMEVIEADPQQGITASVAQVPELAQNPATQLAVLKATVAEWTSPYTQAHGSLAIDQAGWTQSIAFMTSIGLVPKPVTVDQVVSDQLLGGQQLGRRRPVVPADRAARICEARVGASRRQLPTARRSAAASQRQATAGRTSRRPPSPGRSPPPARASPRAGLGTGADIFHRHGRRSRASRAAARAASLWTPSVRRHRSGSAPAPPRRPPASPLPGRSPPGPARDQHRHVVDVALDLRPRSTGGGSTCQSQVRNRNARLDDRGRDVPNGKRRRSRGPHARGAPERGRAAGPTNAPLARSSQIGERSPAR